MERHIARRIFPGAKDWDLGWHQLILDQEFERFANEQLRSADRLLFGRVTFEGMAAYWPTATGETAELMNRLPKFVFTHTPAQPQWANTTVVKNDAASEVQKLKRVGDRNSFVFGSANPSETLMAEDLFDEYRLLVAPILLGTGKALFGHGLLRQRLKLLDARHLESGGVILRYEPIRNG